MAPSKNIYVEKNPTIPYDVITPCNNVTVVLKLLVVKPAILEKKAFILFVLSLFI